MSPDVGLMFVWLRECGWLGVNVGWLNNMHESRLPTRRDMNLNTVVPVLSPFHSHSDIDI